MVELGHWIGTLTSALGRGLFAGLIGTVVMTVVQLVEIKITGRQPSTAPADAAAKVLGVEPRGPAERSRFSNLVHFAYGTTWGALRGLLGITGLAPWLATLVYFAVVWGTGLVLLPALGVAPPVTKWGAKWVVLDAAYHVVYAVATGLTYEYITR
jgi:hypothetical protein